MRWGILGLGTIADEFATAMRQNGRPVYAAASRSKEKAESFALCHGIERAYGSYEQMLADPQIDVVYVATPHCNHAQWIHACLMADKHVLCEKAITVNSRQLNELTALAQARGRVLSEAMTIYHMPLYTTLRRMVQQGLLGELKMIQVSFGSHKEYDVQNRFFNPALAGGALLDIGTYALSFTRWFLSEKPDVILTTYHPFETGVDEKAGILLQTPGAQMATITLTMRAELPKRGIVAGEKGYLVVDDFPRADRAAWIRTDGTQEEIRAGAAAQALWYEAQDMEAYIKGEKSNLLSLSGDVMDWMTRIRRQWGMRYPFEQE